jgi:ketosteroid isomerase-like protein
MPTSADAPSLSELHEIIAAYNNHDLDGIVNSFAEDGVFELSRGSDPWGTRLDGRNEIRKFLQERFRMITDMRWETLDLWITGNRAVLEFLVTGTGTDGQPIRRHGCDLWTFKGKKVVRKDTYWKSPEAPI